MVPPQKRHNTSIVFLDGVGMCIAQAHADLAIKHKSSVRKVDVRRVCLEICRELRAQRCESRQSAPRARERMQLLDPTMYQLHDNNAPHTVKLATREPTTLHAQEVPLGRCSRKGDLGRERYSLPC